VEDRDTGIGFEALIRVAGALDARAQEVLAPALEEIRRIEDTFGLLHRIALDLDREIARLILLWIGLEIPPEGKEAKAPPPEREPYPALPAFQAVSSLIPVTISLAALLERESAVILPSPPPGPEGGERREGGAPGYPVPHLVPVPAILMAAGLQKRIMHALPDAAAGLSRGTMERISLHFPEGGKGLPEPSIPASPPTDLAGIVQMTEVPRRIIGEMVKAGEGWVPVPPRGRETETPPRLVAEALALERHLLQDVTDVSPVAAHIARIQQISGLVQQPAGAFSEEVLAVPPTTRMPPGEELWVEAPIPSPPVSRPAALRPIIEIPHLTPVPREAAPAGHGIPPSSREGPSPEPLARAAPPLPAAPGLMEALGGLAAARNLVSGSMDRLAPFIRGTGGMAAEGIAPAVPVASPVAGPAAAWPWVDWIPPSRVAETLAAGLPFGMIPSPKGGEAPAPFPASWPMGREILPGLPVERLVSLMPDGAGTTKAMASVLEPLLVTIPPAGIGGPPMLRGFPAPVSPIGQILSLAVGGSPPAPPARNEISIANTFQIEVSVKGHDSERELRELGEKIGTILSDELKRYGGTLWR
jgi:hypothetical protein